MQRFPATMLISTMLMLGVLLACGGNGLPHSSTVVANVTPAQATVQVGGTVTLTGSATGFTQGPIAQWWIQESKDLDFNNGCGKLDTQAKDFAGCPYGFVMFHDVTSMPSIATYYAPRIPGTYHVIVSFLQSAEFDSLRKTATATITVTP
jgi:hypothetical protein